MGTDAQGVSTKRIVVAIVFFPITMYFFLGSFLLFLIYAIDWVIHACAAYAPFLGLSAASDDPWSASIDYFHEERATKWHVHNMWLVVFAPIAWPFMALYFLFFLALASTIAIVKALFDVLKENMGTHRVLAARSSQWSDEIRPDLKRCS